MIGISVANKDEWGFIIDHYNILDNYLEIFVNKHFKYLN